MTPNSPLGLSLIDSPVYRIFKRNPLFKTWVENTQLFHALIQDSGTGVVLQAFTPEKTLELDLKGKQVYTVFDLPIELVLEFAENYPGDIKI
jgi:hypothetical protein